ncbi:MAG TPA: hypothetical protein VN959_11305 [Mycobacterium sp.]|nr:hypothetical protein [Mycobacterium sp.]
MRNIVRNMAAGAALGGSLLFTAGPGLAGAAPPSANSGVDLAIGNIKILQNASLDTASVAGAVCNINTAQPNTLAQRATTESNAQTVCSLPGGVVTFSQAGSVNSGAGPAAAPAAGMPNYPMNPTNPMNPSEQQPG